jgi:hypothetical protein
LILVASASQNASAIPLGRIVERPPPAIFFIMLQMILVGETTVEAESAPVREDYPDGRILYVLHTGDVVTVSELQGFGQGFWFRVKLANNNNNNNEASSEGWLDVRLTSYFEDMRSGRLHQ